MLWTATPTTFARRSAETTSRSVSVRCAVVRGLQPAHPRVTWTCGISPHASSLTSLTHPRAACRSVTSAAMGARRTRRTVPRKGPSAPGAPGTPDGAVSAPESPAGRRPAAWARPGADEAAPGTPGSLGAALEAFCERRGRPAPDAGALVDPGAGSGPSDRKPRGGAAVIPIGRVPARREPPEPASRLGRSGAAHRPAQDGPPARRGLARDLDARGAVISIRHDSGVVRMVKRPAVHVRPHPTSVAPGSVPPPRRPGRPRTVTAPARRPVVRTAVLVLLAVAFFALVGARARADDRDPHQRRSAGSRLQPARFTRDESALQ